MRFSKYIFNKEYKAAVIELIGDLPERGEVFKARNKEENQLILNYKEIWHIPDIGNNDNRTCVITPVIIKKSGALFTVLQNTIGKTIITPYELIMAVDKNALDEYKEQAIVGPVHTGDMKCLLWWNNQCQYMVSTGMGIYTSQERELLEALECVNFGEKEE